MNYELLCTGHFPYSFGLAPSKAAVVNFFSLVSFCCLCSVRSHSFCWQQVRRLLPTFVAVNPEIYKPRWMPRYLGRVSIFFYFGNTLLIRLVPPLSCSKRQLPRERLDTRSGSSSGHEPEAMTAVEKIAGFCEKSSPDPPNCTSLRGKQS